MSDWTAIIKKYNKSNPLRSWWQIINTIIPYCGLWILMYYSLNYSYWITLGISIVTAGFLVRIFIIFHDCGHGSFFKSQTLNRIVGILLGLLVFTPHHKWHYLHKVHHKTVGNLDKRGMGDVDTLTIEEYNSKTTFQKFAYRIYRNPIILFILAPFFVFTLFNRFPSKQLSTKINVYTHLTTIAAIVMVLIFTYFIGIKTYVLIQIPVLFFATISGVWLFYLQHQYPEVVWVRNEKWDHKTIALNGSSYIKFPRIIQWFSGNIGIHHIHHLSSQIPNYNLEKCHQENPEFQKESMSFFDSFKTLKLRLWDEKNQRLVSFKEAKII